MTFLELCQRLRREVGAAGNGPAAVTGQNGEYLRLIGWVAQAWNELQSERRDWRFNWAMGEIEVSPDFRDYPVPGDLEHFIDDTLILDETPLRLIPYAVFRHRYRTPSRQAPREVTLMPDNTLRLDGYPEASGVLTFEYYRTPQPLIENSDVPRLPERYHLLIVYRAMVQYGLFENAPEAVQQGNANASSLMRDMEVSELPPLTLGGPLA